ncbi:DDE-type integrase/transposase/recombinase [Streptomyces prasinus]
MPRRGVIVPCETIRRRGATWHLTEVVITVKGERTYPWRTVDADGTVLDILVQDRRDTAAARRYAARC